MPAAVAAGIAQTALAAPVVGGLTTALGTGLAAGIAAGGGGGLLGSLGLSPIGTGLGGLAPGVAANIAPAAASQLAGTVAPSLVQASLPGLQGGMGALAPGVTPGLTGSAAQTMGLNALKSQALQGGLAQMPGAAGSQFAQVAPNLAGRDQILQAFSQPNLGQNLTQLGPKLAGDATASSLTPQTSNLAETIRNANTAMRGNAPISYAQGAQGIAPNAAATPSVVQPGQNFMQNLGNLIQNPSVQGAKDYAEEHPYATSAAVGLGAQGLMGAMKQKGVKEPESNAMIRPYTYDRTQNPEAYEVSPTEDSSERMYFNNQYVAGEPYKADKKAEGGIAAAYAMGGPVEQMAAMNAVGSNTGYPMANINSPMYANPMMQRPEATNVIAPSADAGVSAYSGEPRFAAGGISTLGGYSDGGRLLKGPGDGVSDSIPASIGNRQPARLADGEFVVPARIVSEIGNGSTEAGARKLYAMMDRVQKARRKTVGKDQVARNTKAEKLLPA